MSGGGLSAPQTTAYGAFAGYSYFTVSNVTSVTLDDNDPSISYSGTWQTFGSDSADQYYNGSEQSSKTTSSSATITFTGTGIEWHANKKSDRGIATLSLDGGASFNVDQYGATEAPDYMFYQKLNLTYGTHTLKVTVSGTKNSASTNYWVDVDSFVVYSPTLSAAPAAPGDRFQLWNGGTLKEPTLFTVAGVLPNTAFLNWNVFFLPAPQATPANGDMATSVPAPKNPRWLGQAGHVKGLNRTYAVPGGPDQLTLTLLLPPDARTDAINPGRVVQVWRGGSCVWYGILDEPQPAADGWTVTAHGAGSFGDNFAAIYTTWSADDPVNQAIARGLPWSNVLTIGNPQGIYLSQQQDSGSETITSHLNLLITGGGLVWKLIPGIVSTVPAGPWIIQVSPFTSDANGNPTQPPDRLLTCTAPVPRTIAADVNTMVVRYQVTPDVTATGTAGATAATFAVTTTSIPASVAKHGVMEYYLDLSSAGTMTAAVAQGIGQNILTRYVRASFASPFTAGPGQVRNASGQPVDLGADTAGLVYQVIMTDAPYGGEVSAGPLTFMSGAYSYDEDTETATITPFQSVRNDIGSLIGALYPNQF